MKTKEQLRTDAKAFLTQFYQKTAKEGFEKRWNQVDQEIQLEGSYTHTYEELDYGGKLAWRNSNRCVGRLFLENLKNIR